MRRVVSLVFGMCLLTACEEVVVDQSAPASRPSQTQAVVPSSQAAQTFLAVLQRVEPVAERECRARTSNVNCDFKIVIDDRKNQPPNAFQTLDRSGRPIIAFTASLIADARNADEIAFIMSHEAAHHIENHIARQQQNAAAGAVLFTGLATLGGGGADAVKEAQRIGTVVGARTFSKDFELEADALGTVLTHKSGYDPVKGSQFFNRIPDPGNRFLGTHPPNAQRLQVVRQTAAKL
ncbi:MAG: M48 family metallopeptidase [Pseudomonadota bacterium]